ncbi:MAG TPA: SpoIIE family protein phosphatase [Vicinamibacterales bacterium]|nr:SpoIIE family protein phosphatase [Vicinamibacterales bacterium]
MSDLPVPESVSADASEASLLGELFDNSPVPLVVTSLIRDRILAVNRRSEEVFGMRGTDVIGGSVVAFYSNPDDRQVILKAIRETGRLTNHPLELQHPDGRIVSVLFNSRRIVWYGEPAIIGAFVDLTAQREAEQSLAASQARLAGQSRALTSLTERSLAGDGSFADRVNQILESAAATLDVARLSVWRLNRDTDEIECVNFLQRTGTPLREGVGLKVPRVVCPPYFSALEAERVIDATDARTDPRTSGFTDSYLVPNGIGAMLDVPLRQASGTLGVLCAEHVGGPRAWTFDEQNFAISVANLLAAAFADAERREAIVRLQESEARATLIVDTAHDAFVGIDRDGRIVEWNAQAASIFGWTRAEALGRPLTDTIVPPEFRAAHTEGLRRFHATGEAPILNHRLELRAMHRSGREFPIELTVTSPLKMANGIFFGAFLRDISDRLAHETAIVHAREAAEESRDKLDLELASAGQMQRTILPKTLPDDARVRFAATYQTSRHAGGDYYDVIQIDEDRFALVVIDVSGHGARAAIVMAMIRAVIRSEPCGLTDPACVLQHVNRHFKFLWETSMFATGIVAVLDARARTLRVSSAGHMPPLLIRGGQVTEMTVTNAPLLLWEEFANPAIAEVSLEAGDRVVLYTDGITDRCGPHDSRFDLDRVMKSFARHSGLEMPAMLAELDRELDAFACTQEPDDDQTVLAVEID